VGKLRVLFGVLAGLLLAVSVLLTVLRNIETGSRLLAMATSFASYAFLGYLLALLVLLLLVRKSGRARPWLLTGAGLALVGLVLHGWWLAPLFVGPGGGHRTDLTVMTANLEFGDGDPTTVVRAATDRHVDVLVLEEVTPSELTHLRAAGLSELLPKSAGVPTTSASGTMVFSTYDLTDEAPLPVANGGLSVTVKAPRPFRLLAVHTAQPVNSTERWRHDLVTVRDQARDAVKAGPTLVVGDLNATRDHLGFRRILATGLSDADDVANSGWQPTWPTASRAWYLRPLVTIDHVLSSGKYAAVRTSTVSVPGTDHRALVVELDRL
jgi:endonuclease/exonuclease/phosphatase (EEP) superfamily protein YafD